MPRSRKEPKPEDILMRVFRVAEILLEAQTDQPELKESAVLHQSSTLSNECQKHRFDVLQ